MKSLWCLLMLYPSLALSSPAPEFLAARPVWPEGRETERNLFVGFRASFDAPASGSVSARASVPAGSSASGRVVLRVTGSTLYRAFFNGEFRGYGPARGPHGWFRVDEWDLTDSLKPGRNLVAIEVAGYNVNSYYTMDQPSFLEAEIVADGRVVAATGDAKSGFAASVLGHRVQKVQRYSFQRPFCEFYRLAADSDRWRSDPSAPFPEAKLAVAEARKHLPRRIPYLQFTLKQPAWQTARGTVSPLDTVENRWGDRSLTATGPTLGGYKEEELEAVLSTEGQRLPTAATTPVDLPWDASSSITLGRNGFQILDLGRNRTGFIGATLTCSAPARIYIVFDEILRNGDVDFLRMGTASVVRYDLSPGTHRIETFEPYTMRYLKFVVAEGVCEIRHIHLREYANDATGRAEFAASDRRLGRIYEAARETYRQNAVDVFTDCPSRERAGWLCDSFFTARAALDLCGDALMEKNFVENYLLPPKFEHLPDGMLPMCYPADHNDGVFIPNWALWFVVQLEEYGARSGDTELVRALEPRVRALFDYFEPFRNSDGLLEKLESWVFIEWSDANKFTQDVNYPTNMLYAGALDAAGRMYGDAALRAEAARIRETIRRQSFDGEFFVDNALRKDGRLEVTRNRTEVCQYYAFFFDVAMPETHAVLCKRLVESFGPGRKNTKAFPEIRPPNAFIGSVLRLELLSRMGETQRILDEAVAYYLPMAEQTGTLWENDGAYASCNHGFASLFAFVMNRDLLGVRRIDRARRVVTLRPAAVNLDWYRGRIPVGDDALEIEWWKDGGATHYRANPPAGYDVAVENPEGVKVVREP